MSLGVIELDHPLPFSCPRCGVGVQVSVRVVKTGAATALSRGSTVDAGAAACPGCGCRLVVKMALQAWAVAEPSKLPVLRLLS